MFVHWGPDKAIFNRAGQEFILAIGTPKLSAFGIVEVNLLKKKCIYLKHIYLPSYAIVVTVVTVMTVVTIATVWPKNFSFIIFFCQPKKTFTPRTFSTQNFFQQKTYCHQQLFHQKLFSPKTSFTNKLFSTKKFSQLKNFFYQHFLFSQNNLVTQNKVSISFNIITVFSFTNSVYFTKKLSLKKNLALS